MANRRSLFLWVVVTVGLLISACGTSPAADQPAEAEQSEGGEAAEGAITLTVWDFGGVDFEWMDTLAIPQFEEMHPNIQIEHLGVPEDELGIKLETAIAANQVPDLAVFVPNRLMKSGHLVALNDLMERDGFKLEDFCTLISRSMLEDKVFSLPMNVSVWAMMYNKDLFAAAGLPELTADTVTTLTTGWTMRAPSTNRQRTSKSECGVQPTLSPPGIL
jgi:ABC-type glycerol-3-phosphate transport system substrate-binding protein